MRADATRTATAVNRSGTVANRCSSEFTLVRLALFVLSMAWNVRIGEHASNTATNGAKHAAWMSFFGTLAALIASLTLLLLAIDGRNTTS